jgi:hypothetical protein
MTRQPSPRGGHRPRHGRRCRPSSPRLPRERGAGWRKGGCVAPQCPASLATPHHSAPSSSPSGEEDVGQAAAGGSQAGAGETSRRCLALLPYTVELPFAASRGGQTPPAAGGEKGRGTSGLTSEEKTSQG